MIDRRVVGALIVIGAVVLAWTLFWALRLGCP